MKKALRIPPAIQQKQAIFKMLGAMDIVAEREHTFDWMKAPKPFDADADIGRIAAALSAYRGYRDFPKSKTPSCDFYLPALEAIIEYDERQHFTIPRAIALRCYPEIRLGFDKQRWITICERVHARDNDPVYRDEQRALYDSVRDIFAARHGLVMFRVIDGDADYTEMRPAEFRCSLEAMLKSISGNDKGG